MAFATVHGGDPRYRQASAVQPAYPAPIILLSTGAGLLSLHSFLLTRFLLQLFRFSRASSFLPAGRVRYSTAAVARQAPGRRLGKAQRNISVKPAAAARAATVVEPHIREKAGFAFGAAPRSGAGVEPPCQLLRFSSSLGPTPFSQLRWTTTRMPPAFLRRREPHPAASPISWFSPARRRLVAI